MKTRSLQFVNRFSLALAFGLLFSNAQAQLSTVSYTAEDAVITQNFDALNGLPKKVLYRNTTGSAVTGVLGPWDISASTVSNKSELTGWQLYRSAGTLAIGDSIMLNTSSGTNGVQNLFHLGKAGVGLVSDRALGGLFNSLLNGSLGVVLINNSGKTLTSFDLSYKGEQWGNAATAKTLAFKYAIGGADTITSIAKGAFTAVTSLNFVSPNISSVVATSFDGNDPANSATIAQTISGIVWAPGQALVLRWDGASGQLAIDDVVFSATTSLSSLSYTTSGTAVTQNFDILSALGTKTFYTNTTGALATTAQGPWDLSSSNVYSKNELKGWQVYKTGGSTAIDGVVNMGYSPGGNATQTFFFMGSANTVGSDQSLGGNFGSTMNGAVGLVLQNNTGRELTSFTLSYAGEQWRKTNVAYTIHFKYAVGTAATISDISKGTFTAVTDLDFVTPNLLNDVATDGNLDANRVVKSHTVTGISWANGAKLVLRWDCATGQVGIDDVSFSATGPSTAVESVSTENALTVFPTVTNELINVTLATKSIVVIYNTVGAQLLTVKANEGVNTISLADLAAGVYIVKAEGKIAKVLKK
jgi:hypothetical protein